MGKKFIVSAYGKYRPGIVAEVSQVLYEYGCNLEDSRMDNLSGEFSLLILFSGPEQTGIEAKLSDAFSRLESEKAISAHIRPVSTETDKSIEPVSTHTLKVEGLDHTGIVYKISKYLADREINIANLESSIIFTPESGAPVYTMEIQIQIQDGASMEDIETGLGQVADELNVEITLNAA